MNNKVHVPAVIEHRITKVNGQIGFKKYKRGKLLGEGAFAKCYQCINLESQKSFAIKVISKMQLDQEEKKEKVLLEIKIHKTLRHQNIVKFDNAFEDTENIYIVAELCSNQSLLDLMKKRGKISLKDARKYIIQIIKAVQYMHQNQIIHRDLKLANIFLDQDMKIKVGDFGEATKLQFADEKKVSVCGTLNYLAPEIVSGPFGHSFEVDFWAIGVVSFAMLFGKSPFQSKDENETLEKIKQCKYEFPNVAIPSEAKDFIRKILVADPKKRMNLQKMLQHPFLSKSQFPIQKSIKSENALQLSTQESLKQNHKDSFFERLKIKSNLFLKLDTLMNRNSFLKSAKKTKQSQKPLLKSLFDSNKKPNQVNQSKNHIVASVDFTKSSGLGFLTNNQIYGVYFNDNTVVLCDEQKRKIYFVNNPKVNPAHIDEYTFETLPKDKVFQKKYSLLDRYIESLNNQTIKHCEDVCRDQTFEQLIFVKEWWKNSQATMFSLSNDHFQVSFVDGSQTVFNPSKNTIFIKSKDGIDNFFDKIEEALSSKDSELKKKSLYTKEIYLSIQNKKKRMNSNVTR